MCLESLFQMQAEVFNISQFTRKNFQKAQFDDRRPYDDHLMLATIYTLTSSILV